MPADEVPAEMAAALNEAAFGLLQLEGVNGIDVGVDEADEYTLRLLVNNPDDPPGGLPDSIGGFAYILVAGTPQLEQAGIPDQKTYGMPGSDPIMGGIQLGPAAIMGGNVHAGTLGCVFLDPAGLPVAVSNAHVICGAVGDAIQQPAPQTDPAPTIERLGSLHQCLAPDTPSLFPGGLVSGFFDAALCSVDGTRTAEVGRIADIGVATAISSPRIGSVVRKRGYRTGVSHGVVEGTLGAYKAHNHDGSERWMLLGQVSIVMIPDLGLNPQGVWSRSGDSGSVVVNESNEIVALHWGGDGMRGYATDFAPIAVAFGLGL
ncbi:hypothetical protein ACIHEJ_35330 [Streptomyces sp. NPDC052301]|uniref:hypothetical protein n=1 Tax=Streptomyces sp. NPDC052301 TaxID=3365687 RepID=UPI0037D5B734